MSEAESWPPGTGRLDELPRTLRLWLTGFLGVLSFGYALGLRHVVERSGTSVADVAAHYGPGDGEFEYGKSLAELLETTHNHTISFALIFFALGAIFAFTRTGPRLKAVLLLEPWLMIPVTFGSMFGTRFVSPAFAGSMALASFATACAFAAMVALCLRDLWTRPATRAPSAD